MKRRVFLGAAMVGIGRCFADAAFDPTSAYEERAYEGFHILVNRKALDHDPVTTAGLDLLQYKLREVTLLLPEKALKTLRNVRIWVEWENSATGGAEYHPSAEWLREHGYNPEKARSIEISNLRHFNDWTRSDQPMCLLHELSHAYHHQVLGFDNAEVKTAYERAVKSGRYDEVAYVRGGKKRAYALNNPQEFFAELSEAYFGLNDFYPFTYDDLRRHDPESFRLLEQIWGKRK